MNNVFCLGTLLVLACAGAGKPSPAQPGVMMSDEPQDGVLQYRLETGDSHVVGQAVILGFTLENLGDETLWILKWYTPLEGIAGKIFRVTRDGEDLPYQGLMVKRGDPRREDYVRLGPGESASQEVDLSEAYDLSLPGEYRVEFSGWIYDVVRDEAELPRVRDQHQRMEVPGDPVTFRLTES